MSASDGKATATLGDATIDEPGAAAIQRGASVGRYVVLDAIGAGAMGEVYSAYDPELDRKVALKLMHPELDVSGPSRLLREAQAMARLSHPNVITVHDVGEHGGRVFVAMEFVAGKTLRAWIEDGPHPWREVIAVMSRAGRGLAAAHAKGLVHRDFKPDNVMLDDDPDGGRTPRVRVMDFGLARPFDAVPLETDEVRPRPRADALGSDLTAGGVTLGTPAYMAPEQHLAGDVDARSDQFAFCVTVWEALWRERPFPAATIAGLVLAVTRGKPSPPTSSAGVPSAIRRALERGLATEPDQRWPTMDALLVALGHDPAGRRRLVAVGAIALGILGGAIALQASEQRRQKAACEEAGRAVSDALESRIPAIESAFASAPGYAASSVARVVPRLFEHADAWSGSRTRWCTAAQAEAVDAQLQAQAQACLEERADAIVALADLLGRADADVVRRSVQAVEMLAPISSCDDEPALRRRAPLPDGEALRDELAALRKRRAVGVAAYDAGRFRVALETIEAMKPDVDAFAWAPLTAEIEYDLGMLRERTGDFPGAEAALLSALQHATASGHDELAAKAASYLVTVIGVRSGRTDEGLRWGGLTDALITRLGIEDGYLAARHANVIGALLHKTGDHDGALAAFERSLRIREQLLGPDHFDVAESLNNIGAVHFVRQDFVRALAVNERALAIREGYLGPDHPDVGSSYNNLGSVLLARKDFAGALPKLRRALAIWDAAFGPAHPNTLAAVSNVGTALRRTGDAAAAVAFAQRAVAIAELMHGLDHPAVAAALDNLGTALAAKDDPEGALAQLGRALAIQERAPTDALAIATARFAVARATWAVGRDRETALASARRAREELARDDTSARATRAAIEHWIARREADSSVKGGDADRNIDELRADLER